MLSWYVIHLDVSVYLAFIFCSLFVFIARIDIICSFNFRSSFLIHGIFIFALLVQYSLIVCATPINFVWIT